MAPVLISFLISELRLDYDKSEGHGSVKYLGVKEFMKHYFPACVVRVLGTVILGQKQSAGYVTVT